MPQDQSSTNPSTSGPLTAVYAHNSTSDPKIAHKAITPIVGKGFDTARCRYLSSWGQLLTPTAEYRPCGHYLSPLDPSFKRAIILRSAIPLPASDALGAVLGAMLDQMGEGSEVWIESPKASNPANTWVTSEQLASWFPSCQVDDQPNKAKHWLRVSWSPQLQSDLDALGSIYPKLAGRLDEFAQMLEDSEHPCEDPKKSFTNSIIGSFVYSMHWALHTHGAIKKITKAVGQSGPMKILDIGGSYGFLTCELAACGHQTTNLEMIEYRIDQVLPWMVEATGVRGRVDGIAKRMEELEGIEESLDMICFMGSLLCIDREDVSGVLARASKLLKPGGLIVLRENMLLPENAANVASVANTASHEERFIADELHRHLQTINLDVFYMDHLGHQRTAEEATKLWTLFAAVQKQPAHTQSQPTVMVPTTSREMSS